jgi:hypothetical protein
MPAMWILRVRTDHELSSPTGGFQSAFGLAAFLNSLVQFICLSAIPGRCFGVQINAACCCQFERIGVIAVAVSGKNFI